MSSQNFVHLHLHTEYSLLDGVAKVKPLLEKVKEQGMNACAITDHGVMYGVYEFWNYAKELGIKPILGCEIYVAHRTRHDKETGVDNKRYHLTLFAKNLTGYKNLLKIVSKSHTEGFYYKPRADRELLEKYGEGLIALSGCLASNFNRHLAKGERAKAVEWLSFLKKNIEHVYVEVQRNGIKESHDLIPEQVAVAKELGLELVATCDTHYLEPEDHKIQEIVWCISDGRKLTDPERRRYGSTEFYLKNAAEMHKLFPDYPEAVENSQKIADMVEIYNIEFDRIQPRFDESLDSKSTRDLLYEHTMAGAKNRYDKITPELQQRIDYELEVIHDKGYDDYFLVVEDYINWARRQDILVGPGRGSGAGSVVAYCLGITNLDPIKWDLIFERFLNPERMSPPDFDIDFQDDRRDELFRYMSEKYGRENTSFIGTFGRLKTKAAIRDVARVMGVDLSIADKLSKMVIVKFGRVHSIKMMREEVSEFDQIIRGSSQLEELSGYVGKLENLARHVSIHACGYLVTPSPITDYVPVQLEQKGGDKIITQIEGHNLEPLGLMKFDFLGLSNLTVIANTIKQVKYTHNVEIDIDTIPLDDEKTFKLFQEGNTTGVFQFESDGMKKYLRDLKPTEVEDLIFLNAAYRPGPMKYIPDYIKRKQGKEPVKYPDPSLEQVLKPTYGFAIYQEQVMNIAVVFAGYSQGEADMLRRAMGKKKPEVMAKEKEKFLAGAQKQGHSKKVAEEVFAYMEPFADYGFNRSHSACYSLIAYQTAYLKANYPLEFLAGLMETDINSSDKLTRDLREAKAMSIKLKPPSVNHSFYSFSIENGDSIRFGLGGIKGGGEKAMKRIVEQRIERGAYTDMLDLVTRVGSSSISRKDLEALVKVGAFDEFGNRNQMLEFIPFVTEAVSRKEKSMMGGQGSLFGDVIEQHEEYQAEPPELPSESEMDRLTWEKELLGAYISSHPLDRYGHMFLTGDVTPSERARGLSDGSSIRMLATISAARVIYTKRDNKPMAFVELEDIDGKFDCVMFTNAYDQLRDKLGDPNPVVVVGKVSLRNDEFSVIIDDLIPIQEYNTSDEITISILEETNKDRLLELKTVIKENPGHFKLKIVYGTPMNRKEIVRTIEPKPDVLAVINRYRT
ncbi:MAG: DNA polymerase III subunit alpha [candidate division WS6 bacterium OLB20]|uniref:DNA polymerase III subunit alpha n=1 Tax=candidate division WS6 bacterium OLB20 TaxID=1617426 RepID=A0A136LXP6_9BACT|nr:MAG: DNA polymerase III subunit alpha [candidate division WS6 bacterium OLB20]